MTIRGWLAVPLAGAMLLSSLSAPPTPACCPAPPSGKPVLNADQTVAIIWDAANKMQHFIRQASFKSEADDFGFLVPTPSEPQLEESGNDAFPYLLKLTEPERLKRPRPAQGISCGCSDGGPAGRGVKSDVRVVNEKLVAGFHAVVLEAKSADALTGWLKSHGYAYSPEIEAWAKPYIADRWMITALKVAKGKEDNENKRVTASALRMSFKTDRPLFPYREPDPTSATKALGTKDRLLRIYFLAEARYQGELAGGSWKGKAAWSNKLNAENRKQLLESLKLPETTGPAEWWLTEFEDNWRYGIAPGDVYFSRDPNQDTLKREPIIEYTRSFWPTDVTVYAIAAALFVPPLVRRVRRGPKS